MAKRALPSRKPRDRSRDDESLLLESAESLGRMIGALQRQLDDATKRLSNGAGAKNTTGAAGKKANKTAASKKTRRQ